MNTSEIIKSKNLRYFIFDTGVTGKDIDFVQYNWSRSRYNKVREGDYFLYRRPQKVSENKKFYFFGSGRVGEIIDYTDNVICKVIDPIRFKNIIFQDDIKNYEWAWKSKKRNDFQQFFNNYGMNQIPYEDIIYFLKEGIGENISEKFERKNRELVEAHKLLQDPNKGAVGKSYKIKSRGSLGKIFSDNIRVIYNNKCCITGISTRSLTESSHISPWGKDKKNRGNNNNGLLLSLVFHKCFDNGLISIDEDYKVLIGENISDKNLKVYLEEYRGKKIKLPIKKEFYPDQELLEQHRVKWNFK